MGISVIAIAPRTMVLLATSTATLGIAGVFTSATFDISLFKDIRVSVFADQISATGGIAIQQTADGTNYDKESKFTYDVASDTEQGFIVDVLAKTGRVKYTNGGVAQTIFRIFIYGVP